MTDCPKAKGFDPTLVGERHGLTCGYWTNSGEDLDRHVVFSHSINDDIYDLMDEQYEQDQAFRAEENPGERGEK